MKILTVSIAAYNVEKFLKDTLESLCDKRYINDIEVLVIDDGSIDNTGIIATEFQKKYPTSIKYIAKENGGHGSTINKGIELASGKYFRILDGDDYVDRDAFYSYITKLKSCDIDVVITDYWWVDNLKNKYQHGHKIFSVLQNNVEFQYDHSIDSSIFGLSTLSIKTELLQMANVKITEKCFYVDVEFIIWAVYLSKSYVYFNDKVYMYRCIGTAQNSINKASMLKNVKMQEKVVLKMCDLYEDFYRKQNCNDVKKKIILNRIMMSEGATYRTYLLMNNMDECKRNIDNFSTEIKEKSQSVYEYTLQNKFIKYIQNEHLIPIIKYIYNIYIWTKKWRKS